MKFHKKQKKHGLFILIILFSITILGMATNLLNIVNPDDVMNDLDNESLNQKTAVYHEWNRSYEALISNSSNPDEDVALDSNKNIYVAGYEHSVTTNYDILLIKYNQSGDFEWPSRFKVIY